MIGATVSNFIGNTTGINSVIVVNNKNDVFLWSQKRNAQIKSISFHKDDNNKIVATIKI